MRVELLGALIDALDLKETEEKIASLVKQGGGHQVVTLNPEYLYRAQYESRLLDMVNSASVVTPDGEGIVWACKKALRPVPERVTGIDLVYALARRASEEGWRVFLLGAAHGVAEKAAQKLEEQYPGLQVAGTHHGYFSEDEEEEVLQKIDEAAPHLLFVALGAPRQEFWIHRHLNRLNCAAMGIGGSFDVIAGNVTRAPAWVQRIKAEWLYRMVKEPSRWRRGMVLPGFAWQVLRTYRVKT